MCRLSAKCFEFSGEFGEDELYDGYRSHSKGFKHFLCEELTNDCKPEKEKEKVEL